MGKFKTQASERRDIRKQIDDLRNRIQSIEENISLYIVELSCSEIEEKVSELGRLNYKIDVLENDLKNIRLKKISIH